MNLFAIFTALISILLAKSSLCAILNCKYSTFGTSYKCSVQNVHNLDSPVKDAIGIHEGLNTNDDVTWLIVSNKTMSSFPKCIDRVFKNLKGIVVSKTELSQVTQDDLKVFTNLKILNLNSNKIGKIDGNLFEFNGNLEFLSLMGNEISHVDPRAFSQLKKLKHLALNGNKCGDCGVMRSAEDVEAVKKLVKDIESGLCADN